MGAALPFVALAAAAGGQIMGGIEENKAQRAAARVDEENGRLSLLAGEEEALQTRRDERRIAGDMLSAMAGGGGMVGTGSAGDVLAQSAYQRELEILNIRRRSTTEANNLYQSAKDRRKAGKSAIAKSVFGAVSSALNGASAMRSQGALSAQGGVERAAHMVPRMRVTG